MLNSPTITPVVNAHNGMEATGALYVVSTPIGNLSDITLRAIETLKSVDIIAAEDTRHSRYLLDNYEIKTKTISIHQHNESQRISSVKQQLSEGKNIALISDAGTPLISDPGYRLVAALKEDNFRVITIPGVSALVAALSISGLPTDKFFFAGFLSSKQTARMSQLNDYSEFQASVILYEAPHRLKALVDDIIQVFGPDKLICIARELTKKFETVKLAKASEVLQWLEGDSNQLKGECVVIIAPAESLKGDEQVIDTSTLSLLSAIAAHTPPKVAVSIVSEHSGIPKKALYEKLLSLKELSS